MTQPERDKPVSAGPTGVTLSRPIIVSLLYLANIVMGFSVFVGVVLAYIWRNEEETLEWEKTHFTYAIRTFWIGFVLSLALLAVWFGSFVAAIPFDDGQSAPPDTWFLIVFFSGFGLWFLLMIWFCIRSVMSLARAGSGKPMPNPETWLF